MSSLIHPMQFRDEQVLFVFSTHQLLSIVGNIAFPVPAGETIRICAWCDKERYLTNSVQAMKHPVTHSICRTHLEEQKRKILSAAGRATPEAATKA